MPNLSYATSTWVRLTRQDERQWLSKMRGYFTRQVRPLIKRINEADNPALVQFEVDQLITENELLDIYQRLYVSQGEKYYVKIVNTAKEFKGEIVAKELDANSPYFRNMGNFVQTVVANRVKTIVQTSRNMAKKAIQSAIAQSVEEGMGVIETTALVERAVKQEWRNMKKFRPQFIARTEVASISNRASFMGAVEVDIPVVKKWSSVIDGRTRESHVMANGMTADLENPFNIEGVLMQHPGEVGAPAEQVINCRCRLSYVA